MSILTQYGLLLVKVETTPGVDALPTPPLDAVQISSPAFTVDVTWLDRKFTVKDFSQWPSLAGRKTATLKFNVELSPSGVVAKAPRWARLFEGASMLRGVQTSIARTILTTNGVTRASNVVTASTTTAHGFTAGQEVVVAGVTDTSYNGTVTILTVPSATSFTFGQVGANGTSASGTTTLVAGESFTPITENQSTLTVYYYAGGWLHVITGAMANWTLEADAGSFGMLSFTVQGNYNAPIAGTFPTNESFDNQNPSPVEYASIVFGNETSLAVSAIKYDMGNTLVAREDVNYASGFRGFRISSRSPTGGLDPEAELTHTFWSKMTSTTLGALSWVIGAPGGVLTPGRTIQFSAPAVQISGIAYADRDGLRTYDLSLAFRRNVGNDDIQMLFT